ncbi:MAG: dihydrofolate reductase [Myxococcota bacterium]
MGTTLIAVVAAAHNWVIGADGGMPWRLRSDLKRFKRLTTGHPLVMGRLTHESIGRALPGRTNIIVTRSPDYVAAPGCVVAHDMSEALAIAAAEEPEVVVIGGGAGIYRAMLPRLDVLHLTVVHGAPDGDTFLPALDPRGWREVAREHVLASEVDDHAHTYLELRRVPEHPALLEDVSGEMPAGWRGVV